MSAFDDELNMYYQWVVMPGMLSLVDETVLKERFGLEIVPGHAYEVSIFQSDIDKEFCGDILDSKMLTIDQYRAFCEPIPGCYPILRARGLGFGDIYPLVAIPFGKGFFVLGGMDLSDAKDQKCMQAFEIACKAIAKTIEYARMGKTKSQDERLFRD